MKKAPKTPKPKMDRATDLWRRALPHLRRNMRLSQAELAALAGISQQSLSKFEDGSRALSAEAFARLEGAVQKATRDRRADAENNWGMKSLGFPDETPEQKEEWEQIKKETDEWITEWKASLPKAEDFPKLLDPYRALLKEPKNAPKILEGFKELLAVAEQVNRGLADLMAKGYAILPQNIEQENDELKAENAKLRERLRALGELDRKSEVPNPFDFLKAFLDAAKPNPSGSVTITPDATNNEIQKLEKDKSNG